MMSSIMNPTLNNFGIGESPSHARSPLPNQPTNQPGMGVAMLCFAAISFLHRSLDTTFSRRWVRLGTRLLFAVLFASWPLVPSTNATPDLAINAGSLALVVYETIGKLVLQAPPGAGAESAIESGHGPGARSREQRAKDAGFKIDDLTWYKKYVRPP
jgi:hypothetical protein